MAGNSVTNSCTYIEVDEPGADGWYLDLPALRKLLASSTAALHRYEQRVWPGVTGHCHTIWAKRAEHAGSDH